MTSNIKRLAALAAVQFGSFVIVLAIGAFGGSGHHGPAVHTTSPSPSRSSPVVSPSVSPTPAKTHGGTGGQGTHTTPPATHSPPASTAHPTATAHASSTAHATAKATESPK